MAYQQGADGRSVQVPPTARTPFMCTTDFSKDSAHEVELPGGLDYLGLQAALQVGLGGSAGGFLGLVPVWGSGRGQSGARLGWRGGMSTERDTGKVVCVLPGGVRVCSRSPCAG